MIRLDRKLLEQAGFQVGGAKDGSKIRAASVKISNMFDILLTHLDKPVK